MGGSALGRPAHRLTTAEHDLLKAHCIGLLSPEIFDQVIPLKAPREKQTHGDLDLLCSYDAIVDGKKVKGEDFGIIIDGQDKGVGAHHPAQTVSEARKASEREKEGEENARFRQWVVETVKVVKGDQWKRSGTRRMVISLGIPCNNVKGIDVKQEGAYEPFYQVDLQLLPKRYLEFISCILSWGNTILSHGVSYLSPSLKLHGTHLGLHYSPYFGIEAIKTELTVSPKALCDWLGLDFEELERGFDNEKGLWKWATKVEPGARIETAWKIVSNPKRKSGKKFKENSKAKDEKWAGFVRWLRRGEDSPYRQVEAAIVREGDEVVTGDKGAPIAISVAPADRPHADKASPSHTPATDPRSLIDPAEPAKIDKVAQEAIDLFNKGSEVEEELKKRKIAAVAMAERQKEKQAEKAAEGGAVAGAAEAAQSDQMAALERGVTAVEVKE